MKGDFSRFTFEPRNHYNRLQLQQGRVLVDADWNEQSDIQLHDRQVARGAIIGAAGGPMEAPAFLITTQPSTEAPLRVGVHIRIGAWALIDDALEADLIQGPGYYWLQGRTLTQEEDCLFQEQPYYTPTEEELTALGAEEEGYYLAWVKAFDRHLTALDRPEIREKALGGPDHGTRVQSVWQVRLEPLAFEPEGEEQPTCLDISDWAPAAPTGRMQAQTEEEVASASPCVVPTAAGYRSLENRLYRVEIRGGGDHTTASFVWSQENGVIRVAAVEGSYKSSGGVTSIEVAELGRDELDAIAPQQWVEITDERRALSGEAGYLCHVEAVTGTRLTLSASSALTQPQFDALEAPTVRRWEKVEKGRHPTGATYLEDGEFQVGDALTDGADGGWFALNDGVEVRFEEGTYRTGDYWLIPARTNTNEVEFGETGELPHGVATAAAPLAILHRSAAAEWSVVRDCRSLFPPLTRMAQLHYVGGDGQEAMPGEPLPAPLEVAVHNGAAPVHGVRVRFTVLPPEGGGAYDPATMGYLVDPDDASQRASIEVLTDAGGGAGVRWVLGTGARSQHVTADVLPQGPDDPEGVVRFHANQSIAAQVHLDLSDCALNEAEPPLETVQAFLKQAGIIDPADPAHQNVQHVLHQLLCRLNAAHVPYVFPDVLGETPPAGVAEVKAALDALYRLVLEDSDCCCLTDVLERLADTIAASDDRCLALKTAPIDGDCSPLGTVLGLAVNLARVLYLAALAFLDLQDAAGKDTDKGYEALELGDRDGVNLDALVHGEGSGWLMSRIEERVASVTSMGDRLLDFLLVGVEALIKDLSAELDRDLRGALVAFSERYSGEEAWSGPAARWFLLSELWEPLFGSRRLDDRALLRIHELLKRLVTHIWGSLVQVFLCEEPSPDRLPRPKWLIADPAELGGAEPPALLLGDLEAALERAFSMHGLARRLPPEDYGEVLDVHMVAPSDGLYEAGATWVVATARADDGREMPRLSRWRHLRGAEGEEPGGLVWSAPLEALDERGKVFARAVLPKPDLSIALNLDGLSLSLLGSGARRRSLHLLLHQSSADGGDGGDGDAVFENLLEFSGAVFSMPARFTDIGDVSLEYAAAATNGAVSYRRAGSQLILWELSSKNLHTLDDHHTVDTWAEWKALGIPHVNQTFMVPGYTVLIEGGPDEPPATVCWPEWDGDSEWNARVWAPSLPREFEISNEAMRQVGLPPEAPRLLQAFSLRLEGGGEGGDDGGATPLLAVVLERVELTPKRVRRLRHVLLLLGDAGAPDSRWWERDGLKPSAAWDLPAGVEVVGGAHDRVAIQDTGRSRWAMLSVRMLLAGEYTAEAPLQWRAGDELLTSAALDPEKLDREARWSDGALRSVEGGQDGPWVQALGPLNKRLGLFRGYRGQDTPLERQMMLGATSEDSGSSLIAIRGDGEDGEQELLQVDASLVQRHDYLRQAAVPDSDRQRLMTVCLRGGVDSDPVIEFHVSPRK